MIIAMHSNAGEVSGFAQRAHIFIVLMMEVLRAYILAISVYIQTLMYKRMPFIYIPVL